MKHPLTCENAGHGPFCALDGAMNRGKAQPGRVASVSHGCPSALFRNVNVLNTQQEAGR